MKIALIFLAFMPLWLPPASAAPLPEELPGLEPAANGLTPLPSAPSRADPGAGSTAASTLPVSTAQAPSPAGPGASSTAGSTLLASARELASPSLAASPLTASTQQVPSTADPAAAPSGETGIITLQSVELKWRRPRLLVKAGVGLPNLVELQLEAFATRTLTLELGVGSGLLPVSVTAGARWRPEFSCWGCDGKNYLSAGLGIEAFAFLKDPAELLFVLAPDITYIRRFTPGFGWMVGLRAGAGPTFALEETPKIEPGLLILLQTGVAL